MLTIVSSFAAMIKRCLILSSLLVHAHAAVWADEAPADSLSTTLEEVSVTALKRLNPVMQEPEAVTILTEAELERLGARTIRGVSDVVPNFYMPEYGSRITSTIYVRGIGARMDKPSVGLNVDNVPYLNKDAYDFDVADIAMVEMLRGPQSTLYGRNTMAGVINITTLSPMRYQGWKVFGEFASGTSIKGSVGWYHKFAPDFGFSVTADYSGRNGSFVNLYNGKKVDHERNWALRTKQHWNVSHDLTLRNVASAGFLRQGGYPYEYVGTGEISYNDTCFYRRFTFADGLTASYRGNRYELTSITSVQHIDDNMTLDQDFLPESFFTLTQKKKDTSITEDLVIKGDVGEGKYHWLAGVFAFYKHLDMDAPVTFKDKGIADLIESHRNSANPSYPIEWNSRSFPLNSTFTVPTWGVAAYHESELHVANWTFSAGLRVDYERSVLNYRSYCDTGYAIFHLDDGNRLPYHDVSIDIDDTGSIARDFVTLLPQIAATYTFDSNLGNVYGKISKGYKAGGFNTQMFSDVLQQRLMGIMGIGAQYDVDEIVSFKPEQSWNFEIGSHLNLMDGKLTMELAAFYIDCRDQQLTMFPDGTTTGRIMTNAGKTRSFGGEISVNATLTSRLSFTGSYGYTNAKFRKFFNGINDFKGKTLPYAPQNTLFLQGLWRQPIGSAGTELLFDVNLRGAGKIYWNEENDMAQNFYATLGASATLGLDNMEFQVWGRNLTGTKYHTFYFMSMGNEFLQRGRGVEIGLAARLRF